MVEEGTPAPGTADNLDHRTPRTAPVVAVCGGSGAGKSYLVRQIVDHFAVTGRQVAQVSFDAYYHDLAHLTPAQRRAVNFDHPDSLDGDLFALHVHQLAAGQAAHVPLYDFATHTRTDQTVQVGPGDVVVLDGILLLAFEAVRRAIDLSVYLHVPDDLRHDRRVARDIVERGRDVADVERQWREFVAPMHAEFVEPTAPAADIVVEYGADRVALLTELLARVEALRADLSTPLVESSRYGEPADRVDS